MESLNNTHLASSRSESRPVNTGQHIINKLGTKIDIFVGQLQRNICCLLVKMQRKALRRSRARFDRALYKIRCKKLHSASAIVCLDLKVGRSVLLFAIHKFCTVSRIKNYHVHISRAVLSQKTKRLIYRNLVCLYPQPSRLSHRLFRYWGFFIDYSYGSTDGLR